MKMIFIMAAKEPITQIKRKGFTLVELLVSMAIIIFMLSIMSQAFVIATTCMQGMKTVGELIDKVRPVMTILQRDLAADHFDGTKKLCDPDFWDYGPPREGYFSIIQGGASVQETPASGSVKYYISDSISNHALTFTSKLPSKNPTEFYTAEYPATYKAMMNGIYNYPDPTFAANPAYMMAQNAKRFDFIRDVIHCKWAELAYFIKPNGSVIPKDSAAIPLMADLPLHDLYRQQRVILPDVSDMNKAGIPKASSNLFNLFSHYVDSAGKVIFNQPSDVTAPWKRFGNRSAAPAALPNFKAYADPTGLNDVGNNSDLVLTNVISFDVRIINDSNLDFLNLVAPMVESAVPGTPVLSGGNVTSIPVSYGGKNYLVGNPPQIKIFGGGGVGAAATATILNGNVNAINVTNPGTGYTSPPNVLIYNDALSEYLKINPNYYNCSPTNTFAIFDTWTMERSQDPSKNYDLGDLSYGPWQPSSGISGNYQLPFWNGITNKGIKINAIQITIRVWDDKSSQARDFVLIQKI